MDTRTSPARLRIEQIQERCARPAAPPSSCRRATRTCRSTCPSAGRRASGHRASPARWRRWSSPPSAPRSSPTAATGCRPSASSPAAASSSSGSRRRLGRAARRLAVRERRARRDGRGRRQRARPGRRAPAARQRSRSAASRCAPISTSSTAAWPERPHAAGGDGLRAPRAARRRIRARASSAQVRAAMRDAGATHHLSRPSTTSPGC